MYGRFSEVSLLAAEFGVVPRHMLSHTWMLAPGRLSLLSVSTLAAVLAIHEGARRIDAFSDMAVRTPRKHVCLHIGSSRHRTQHQPAR
jgi:hypothetical protein